MSGIFISYRRDDSLEVTGRIHDQLELYFGRNAIYRDIDRIAAGRRFPDELQKALDSCQLVLAIIGDKWLGIAGPDGSRRLDDPNDYVRLEIAHAIKSDIPIIPVLVGSSGLPSQRALPSGLEPLVLRQWFNLQPGSGFSRSMRDLVDKIHDITGLEFDDYRSILDDCRNAGLTMIRDNFRTDTSVLDEMRRSHELLVVMNDGRGWLDQNREIIYERLANVQMRTHVMLLHPASPFIDVLVGKNGKTKSTQLEEIKRTYEALTSRAASPEQLCVMGHFSFNPFSLTIGDDYAFVSPYFLNERGALPLLKFARRRNGMYDQLRLDADELRQKATPLRAEDFSP